MKKGGREIDLPSLHEWEGAEDLARAFLDAGMCEIAGMGEAPLSWGALRAWADLTETRLSPGDWEDLRELSSAFVIASSEYRNANLPAPYGAERLTAKASQDLLKHALDGLVASNGKRKVAKG